MSLHNPGILLDRRTNCFSEPEDILAEMEELREELKDYPEFLEEVLQDMERDLAFARELLEETTEPAA